MIDKRHDITSKQLMIFIISSQIGTGILWLPNSLAKETGHDGWITTMLGGIISIIVMIIIMQLLKRYSNKSILEINPLLYGKWLGKLFNSIIFIYFSFLTIVSFRSLVGIMSIIILKATPPVILALLLSIPTLYLTSKGLKNICRFSYILYISYFLMLMSFLLIIKEAKITYLMPIGQCGLNGIFKGVPINIFSFLGFEVVTVIYPNITDKENAQKYMVFAGAFTTIFYAMVVAFATAFFGEVELSKLTFPLYSIERSIKVPIMEGLSIFFFTIWYPALDSALRSVFFSTYYCIKQFFNIKSKNMLILIIAFVFLLLGRIIPPDFESVKVISGIEGYIGLSVLSFLIISYLFSFVNKRGVRSK